MTVVVFDMDGVLYRGKDTLPGAADCVRSLREAGVIVGFLTNNSSRTREDYVSILESHGLDASPEEIMTSSDATVKYLASREIFGARIYVVGESGLASTLARAGYITDTEDHGDPCRLVIIGWDRYFTFSKIVRAQAEVVCHGAGLIATNADPTYPAAEGRILPGAGTMVAAIETACGKKAFVIGKPNTISLELLLAELGFDRSGDPRQVWVVGDRLETDIVCGNSLGARTVCVTTGIADRETAESASGLMRPEFVIDSLTELPPLILSGSLDS